MRGPGLDNTEIFYMRRITVDGIHGMNEREHGYQFFTMKPDYWESEEIHELNGFIHSDEVFWESPYAPIPLMYGEMDEELWLKEGIVCGKKQEEWI